MANIVKIFRPQAAKDDTINPGEWLELIIPGNRLRGQVGNWRIRVTAAGLSSKFDEQLTAPGVWTSMNQIEGTV